MLRGWAFLRWRSRPTRFEMYGVILLEGCSESNFLDQSVSTPVATHCHCRPASMPLPPLLKRRAVRPGAASAFVSKMRRKEDETSDPDLRARRKCAVGTNACEAAAKQEMPTSANVGDLIMGGRQRLPSFRNALSPSPASTHHHVLVTVLGRRGRPS